MFIFETDFLGETALAILELTHRPDFTLVMYNIACATEARAKESPKRKLQSLTLEGLSFQMIAPAPLPRDNLSLDPRKRGVSPPLFPKCLAQRGYLSYWEQGETEQDET